jgi:hypothetical protein
MAAFIVNKSELLKYPTLQNDLADLCNEIITIGNQIVFTPKPGSIANVGMVFMYNHITCNLALDARVLENLKSTSFEEHFSKKSVKKQRSMETASSNSSPVSYFPG